MIIKNRKEIAITKSRKQVLDIIEAGIERVLPSRLIKSVLDYDSANRVLTVDNDKYSFSKGRLFVIGGGKANGLMAETLESIINPEDITAGVVNCKSKNYKVKKIKVIEAGHPFPDQRGVKGVEEMLALKDSFNINENDLVIALISGGGSSLMPCPVDEITLKDKQEITNILLSCGAEINEVNNVRKHLSKVKGGCLGKFYSPTRVISLIISDANHLDTIASGPTVADPSTVLDAFKVLEKYDLLSKAPKRVIDFLRKGRGEETPKSLDNCHNYIIGDNILALETMKVKAEKMGLNPLIVTSEQKGDTVEVAQLRAKEIIEGKFNGYGILLVGGETTFKVPKKKGKGGRNQRYVAASLLALKKYPGDWVLASIATDGSDFLPDAAGAIIDNDSPDGDIKSYLNKYDSYNFFKKIGNSLIETGHTGTNVCDLVVYLLTKNSI